MFGVIQDMIEKKIQRRLDSITPAQVVSLRKIYNSLKDGMSKPSDWFEDIKDKVDFTSKAAATVAKINDAAKVKDILPDSEPCEFCKRTDGLHDDACPNKVS